MKNGPYELKIAPNNYPGKKYRGRYCYEHHLVWWKQHGSLPPKGHEIHHKNGEHRDNSLENLQLVTGQEHRRIHGELLKKVNRKEVTCGTCDKPFVIKGSNYRHKLKVGKTGKFYCARACQHKSMIRAGEIGITYGR